jgi:hypothetical protein
MNVENNIEHYMLTTKKISVLNQPPCLYRMKIHIKLIYNSNNYVPGIIWANNNVVQYRETIYKTTNIFCRKKIRHTFTA